MTSVLSSRARDAVLVTILALLALYVFFQNNPFTRALSPDLSMMMYTGQEIVRGHPPYKYAMIVKTPLTPLLAASALLVARPLGVDDVNAIRLWFLALAATAVALMYLFARDAFHSRAVGWFSALTLLSFSFLGARAASGPEPKLVVLVLGIATCWAIQRRAAWWAGICAALAFLAWQIAGIYLIVALAAFWLGAEPKARWKQSGRVLAGFFLALVPFVLYLAVTGAWYDAWAQTILGNFNFLRGESAGAGGGIVTRVTGNIEKFATASWRCLASERGLLLVGLVGAVGLTIEAVRPLRRATLQKASWGVLAMIAGALGFGLFAAIDFQNCPDLLPFLSVLALGCGWLILRVIEFLARVISRAFPQVTSWIVPSLLGIASVALLAYGTSDSLFTNSVGRLRSAQENIAARVEQELSEGDTVQQFGDAVVLVLTQRTNATPVLHLGPKQHQGIFFMYENGLDGYLAALEAQKPRVITLSRRKDEAWAQKLYAWIQANYHLVESFDETEGGTVNVIDVYVRNDESP